MRDHAICCVLDLEYQLNSASHEDSTSGDCTKCDPVKGQQAVVRVSFRWSDERGISKDAKEERFWVFRFGTASTAVDGLR